MNSIFDWRFILNSIKNSIFILITILRNLDISLLQTYKSSTLYDTVNYNRNGKIYKSPKIIREKWIVQARINYVI